MKDLFKSLARRSKFAIISYKVFDNWRLKRKFRAGDVETIHGSTQFNSDVAESLCYIDKQFRDYRHFASLLGKEFSGARILELGPGDNLGVGLKFLAAGADSVVSLDRFYSKRDKKHEEKIYNEILNRLDESGREKLGAVLSFVEGPRFNSKKLEYIYGAPLEQFVETFIESKKNFDLIVSCAVIEEIFEPATTFQAMDDLLAPNGVLVHKIDLGDYGMFREQGMHPLTFLTIPQWLYKRMASDSALPNRKRLNYYAAEMRSLGYETRVFVTSKISIGGIEPPIEYSPTVPANDESALIDEVRHKLAVEFRQLSPDDLLIDGIWLVAKKKKTQLPG